MSVRHVPASHPVLNRQMAPYPDPTIEAQRRVESLLILQRTVRWDADVEHMARILSGLPSIQLDRSRRALLLVISEELVRRCGA